MFSNDLEIGLPSDFAPNQSQLAQVEPPDSQYHPQRSRALPASHSPYTAFTAPPSTCGFSQGSPTLHAHTASSLTPRAIAYTTLDTVHNSQALARAPHFPAMFSNVQLFVLRLRFKRFIMSIPASLHFPSMFYNDFRGFSSSKRAWCSSERPTSPPRLLTASAAAVTPMDAPEGAL
ncbi:hypothetical protein EV121DRAFT_273817 [Schizophyllum commune]